MSVSEGHSSNEPGKGHETINYETISTVATHVSEEVQKRIDDRNEDLYNEEEVELCFLQSKPACFLILGKPTSGKTTLAKRLAAEWKCELVSATELLLQALEMETEFGQKCKELLLKGEAVPEDMVFQLVREKLHSEEVKHHGYVLEGMPVAGEQHMSVTDQLDMIKALPLKPDFIINIKLPDWDLERRRVGLRVDPMTNEVYTVDVYAPEKPATQTGDGEGEEEGEEEEEEELDEEPEEDGGLNSDIIERLVRRPEDMQPQVDSNIADYKNKVLRLLEDFMADHDQQKFIELDGNMNPHFMFAQLMSRLQCFVLRRAAVPLRLHDPEEEEMPEEIDTEELMRNLAPKEMVAPRHRWKRSRWLRFCPVALKQGNLTPGKPDLAVAFLDKVYCLSSPEAMEKFLKNPRPFLLPPQPRPPCKLSVLGPPLSGKTTLCHMLAHHYGAKILDMNELIKPRLKEEHQTSLDKVREEATEQALQSVRQKLQAEYEARLKEIEEEEAEAEQKAEGETEEEEHKETDEKEEEGGEEEKPEDAEDGAKDENKEKITENQQDAGNEVEDDPETEGETNKPEDSEGIEVSEPSSDKTAAKSKREPPAPPAEVDATHPEVVALVAAAIAEADKIEPVLPADVWIEVLQESIETAEKKMREANPEGPQHGGWILDNFPRTRDQWTAAMEKNLMPDEVICLQDSSDQGNFLVKRWYNVNREFVDRQERLRKEKEAEEKRLAEEEARRKKEEEERRKREEEEARKRAEEEAAKLAAGEEAGENAQDEEEDEETRLGDESTVPTVLSEEPETSQERTDEPTEDGGEEEQVEEEETPEKAASAISKEQDNVSKEMEEQEGQEEEAEEAPVEVNELPPEGPELEDFRTRRREWDREWNNVFSILTGGSVDPALIEIEQQQEETVMNKATTHIERHFQYVGWEYTGVDVDEEEEDAAAAAEAEAAEEEAEEEEEPEEQEEEDPNRAKTKPLGDVAYFCPVSLQRNHVLWPGNPETAAKYCHKIYYFASEDSRAEFLENPRKFLPNDKPFSPPPLRLLLLGPRGAGKTLHGRNLAKKLQLFHIAFKERLHELVIAKTKKKLGPEYEEFNQPEDPEEEEEEEEAGITAPDGTVVPVEEKTEKDEDKEEEEVEYTEDEEAIKANLESDEPLPNEVLDNILPDWWNKEPFKSTGFVLEGFPRTVEEARYLQEKGLFPDCAVMLAVEDADIMARLLPPRMDHWRLRRDKRHAKRAAKKEKQRKKREEAIQKRREELLKEQADRRAERAAERAAAKEEEDEDAEEEEVEEEEEEEEEDDIEERLAEEFEEEEEEEEEDSEAEEDASDRLRNDLAEMYDNDVNNLAQVQDMLEEMLVPRHEIDGGRKTHIVRYSLYKKIKHLVENRHSIFERVLPISERVAAKMLAVGYKQPSRFGRWCPVALSEGQCMQPTSAPGRPLQPVVYRQHIYFLSGSQAREQFERDPRKYLQLPTPKPVVPIRLAVIGPPKSGKTTLCKRFEEEFGLIRLSIGEALRSLLLTQPRTQLARQIEEHARRGFTVPDELAVQALEVALMDIQCQTRGFVLDGYPISEKQVELMASRHIIPVRVIELTCNSQEVVVRATKDRYTTERPYPAHDSYRIMAVKLAAYQKEIGSVRKLYATQHRNHMTLNAEHSKWWLWNKALAVAKNSVCVIQDYLDRIAQGQAARIYDMCITPEEFEMRVSDFEHYCPVSLADRGELVDCTKQVDLKYAVEYRGYYYKLAGQTELDAFLKQPDRYVAPLAPRPLPTNDLRPVKRTAAEVKKMFPIQVELRGYCPVTFLDGKCKYEAILPGDAELPVEYRGKIYYFVSEDSRDKFMRLPEKYWALKLPHKLPPPKQPLGLNLPMLGFMEQSLATALIRALTNLGNVKPKFPFLSAQRSALVYVACHLKAFNPRSSEYVRNKYKKKLEHMQEMCELIRYLGDNMTVRYKDPAERPFDFDFKMDEFVKLKSVKHT